MKIQCPQCDFSREVNEEKIPDKASLATCPKCGHKFYFREPETAFDLKDQVDGEEEQAEQEEPDIWSSLESLDADESRQRQTGFEQAGEGRVQQPESSVPWENLQAHGLVQAFYETIKKIMLSPVLFFDSMPLGPNFTQPLIFYLLVAEIQVLARFFWGLAGVTPQMESGDGLPGLGMFGTGSVLILFLYPVLMALMLFFASGLNHICLTAVKSGKGGFLGTFKVVSYANAPMILAVVPLIGPLAGMLWAVVCTYLGFKIVHQTSGGRVVLAMLLPVLILLLISSFMLVVKGVCGG